MADQLGSAVLTLTVDDKQFNAGLLRAQSAAQTAGGALRNAVAGLGVTTTAAGIAAFVGKQITELDSAAAAVRTLGVDSDELVPRLRALSVEMGNNISTVELTKAAYDVASSGFATAADAANILRAAAVGAKGGFAEVGDVASAVTGVLNAYGKTSAEAGLLVDQFVQTQADGVITVRQYAAEIGSIASIAAASGISIQELNAAIATATLRGVQVPQTFTGLRQAISSIIKPSEQAKDLAESLGIQYNVGALKAKGFAGVLADVQAKTGGATDKLAILLGSVEAQAAVQPLLNDNLIKYNELLDRQAKAAGAAAGASSINARTISGGLQQIGTGFSNLATTLDTVLNPLFAGFIGQLNSILTKLNMVSALAPDAVQKRERQASDIVVNQLPFGTDFGGYFGPATVKYRGKIYKGNATTIREAIIQDLLKQDLQKMNAPSAVSTKPAAAGADPAADAAIQAAAQQAAENDKLLRQSRQRVIDAKALQGLQGIALTQAKQQLEIEQLRTAEAKAKRKLESARGAGDPNAPELDKVFQTAANNLKAALITGSDALKQAAKEAAQRFTDATRQLSEAQSRLSSVQANPQGLNRFLRPDEQFQRVRNSILQLGPDLQTAIESGQQLLNKQGVGLARPLFEGVRTIFENARTGLFASTDGLQTIQQFISDVNTERDAISGVNTAQQNLQQINKELTQVNGSLRDQVADLVRKQWQVVVNVPGGNATGDVIGAVNGAY